MYYSHGTYICYTSHILVAVYKDCTNHSLRSSRSHRNSYANGQGGTCGPSCIPGNQCTLPGSNPNTCPNNGYGLDAFLFGCIREKASQFTNTIAQFIFSANCQSRVGCSDCTASNCVWNPNQSNVQGVSWALFRCTYKCAFCFLYTGAAHAPLVLLRGVQVGGSALPLVRISKITVSTRAQRNNA